MSMPLLFYSKFLWRMIIIMMHLIQHNNIIIVKEKYNLLHNIVHPACMISTPWFCCKTWRQIKLKFKEVHNNSGLQLLRYQVNYAYMHNSIASQMSAHVMHIM